MSRKGSPVQSYTNTSSDHRVWPGIRTPDGLTLELAPGESVDLDVEVTDPYLQPTKAAPTEKESK